MHRAGVAVNVERWAWYSIAVNIVLAALHASVAAVSGSLAVAAEVVHNVVDLLAAFAVLIGLKLASRKSKAFPYGLYKVENLVAAGLAVMIFFSAYEIARNALLAPPATVRAEGWMIALLVASAMLPLLFSHFELRAGQLANSPALIADAREYRVHVFTTGLAFAALTSQWVGFALDRTAALVIVVAVAKTGWDLLRDAMRVLLDASLDADTLLQIRGVIGADPAVTDLKWVTGRNAGRLRFVEAGVTLRVPELARAETVVRRIEASVRTAVPHVERVLIHIEASTSLHVRYAVPLADPAGAISAHFGEAPYFALLTLGRTNGALEEQRILANPHRSLERAKGIRVAEWLVEQKVDVVLTREDVQGKGPAYVLRDAGVELRITDAVELSQAIAIDCGAVR
jgi:cation diffusion facilitator family transporter